ncbi:alpha/beta hydrolase [Aliikangiella maris]|uniref:Alpha/beta hydrolase n=2 Tax=Aliikangiella maris TaxID=3162458 RepID=A0ABV3MMJ5_9GAMM
MRNTIIKIIGIVIKLVSIFSTQKAVDITFKLFCFPAGRPPVRPQEQAIYDAAQCEEMTYKDDVVKIYRWGVENNKPVLLIHGWESRASRYYRIVERLVKEGYSPISFDLPGHGDSGSNSTTILECKEICQYIQNKYGDFEAVIAHSFGVLCAFYAVKNQSVKVNKIVAIGGVTEFKYLVDEFGRMFSLAPKVKNGLMQAVENLFYLEQDIWHQFSAYTTPEKLHQPILVIHDEDDDVVSVEQGLKIMQSYTAQAEFYQTKGLGHKKPLFNDKVVDRVADFLAA